MNSKNSQIELEIITDESDFIKKWQLVTNNKEIYSNLLFNLTFQNQYSSHSHFFLFREKNELICAIPLSYNIEKSQYTTFPEGRYQNPIFFFNIPSIGLVDFIKASLNNFGIQGLTCCGLEVGLDGLFEVHDSIYSLDLYNFQSLDNFLMQNFDSKKRNNLKRSIKHSQGLSIERKVGGATELEKMFELNIKIFGDDSDFLSENIKKAYRNLLSSGIGTPYIHTYVKDIEILSIQFLFGYNNILYHLNGGTNKEFRDLGKFVVLDSIDFGIENKYTTYNAGSGDCNRKESWNFNKTPQYSIC